MDKTPSGYGRKPFMRVGKQTPRLAEDEEAMQAVLPNPFNHRHAFIHMQSGRSNPRRRPDGRLSIRNANSVPSPKSQNKNLTKQGFHNTTLQDMDAQYQQIPANSTNQQILVPKEHTIALKRRRSKNMITPITKKRTFRTSHPVKNSDEVDSDVWQNILSFCEPRFLLEARTINSFFNGILADRHAIWRQSRQVYFGADMPECPEGLNEKQYVDLLVGKGCQNSLCTRQNTAKVYWVFLVRLCKDCLARKTMREEDLPPERRHIIDAEPETDAAAMSLPRELWSLLPMASSTGRRYMDSRSIDFQTFRWALDTQYCIFLKSDYRRLETKYLILLQSKPTGDDLRKWWDTIYSQNINYMIGIYRLELWYKNQIYLKEDLRQVRKVFFQEQAARLTPPMGIDVLLRMAAFHKALSTSNPPTMRSWEILKSKMLPYRPLAERLVQYNKDMYTPWGCQKIDLYRKLQSRRSGRRQEEKSFKHEQEFVLKIAKREFDNCIRNGVADLDLVLLCLNNIFHRYENTTNRPNGLNYDGTMGSYKLSMDDARMVIEEIMEGHISRFSQRGAMVFENFICAGCVRADHVRKWSFGAGLEHVFSTHAQVVGEGLEFWRFVIPFPRDFEYDKRYYRFPWFTVPWPRNLPLHPGHHDPLTSPGWHPDIPRPFVELKKPGNDSAFSGRMACENDAAPDGFAENLVYAAQTLKDVQLSSQCSTRIALQYALDRYSQVNTTCPPVESLVEAIRPVHDANPTMDFKFRCGFCMEEGKVYRSAKHVKYAISTEQLVAHWNEKHKIHEPDWTKKLMHLPSGAEVLDQLLAADQKLRVEQENVSTRESLLPASAKKRPGLKANVIMATPFAMDRFNQLFVPIVPAEASAE